VAASRGEAAGASVREWIARSFTHVEDVVYVGLGVLLAAGALVLLGDGALTFVRALGDGTMAATVLALLDRILLIVMIVEILYTVQVSFREHALVPEPFIIVGLIAVIRRVLVLTAEFSDLMTQGDDAFRNAMFELSILTVMVFVLVLSLALLRRRGPVAAER
jgi:uncharacterized membrane protein (DUF373 family)